MSLVDEQFNSMLQQTQYAKPSGDGDDFWFSFANQKRLCFHVSQELLINGEDPVEAIETSKEFIDEFYQRVIKPSGWAR